MKNKNYSFLMVIFITLPLCATQIDPMLWEEMAVGCDFAGIVECTTAGGIVAEYKVIEAWKGTRHSESIRIRVAVNYWEPQFPMALVGQQYLVFAYSNNAPSCMVSTTSGGAVPLWWRNVEYDFSLPLFQGRYLIDQQQEIRSYDFESLPKNNEKISIEDIRNGVRELTAKSKHDQEITLLKLLYKKYFLTRNKQSFESASYNLSSYEKATDAADHKQYIEEMREEVKKYEKIISRIEPLNSKIQTLTNSIQIIDEIFNLSISNYDEYRHSFRAVMAKGIQATESLEHLKKRITEIPESVVDDYLRRHLPENIQVRINASTAGIYHSEPNVKTYTPRELKEHQKILENYKRHDKYKWLRSFDILVEQQPVFTAKWLAKWKNRHKEWHDEHMGYVLGSLVAYHCKKDKIKCLEILLDAKEPYVRVAGAVYLCFEDEKKGTRQLSKMRKLKGNPGLWASINLARRGDKTAVENLIISFNGSKMHDGGMVSVPCRNLAKRMTVLLSNSAAKSGVPQPPNLFDEPKHFNKKLHQLGEWWNKYQNEITLYDAWLEVLKEQKVD